MYVFRLIIFEYKIKELNFNFEIQCDVSISALYTINKGGKPVFPLYVSYPEITIYRSFVLIFNDDTSFLSFGIKEHAGTKAHSSSGPLQNIVIDTTLTSLPKSFVVCQFGKSDRFVTQFRIDLHDSQSGR